MLSGQRLPGPLGAVCASWPAAPDTQGLNPDLSSGPRRPLHQGSVPSRRADCQPNRPPNSPDHCRFNLYFESCQQLTGNHFVANNAIDKMKSKIDACRESKSGKRLFFGWQVSGGPEKVSLRRLFENRILPRTGVASRRTLRAPSNINSSRNPFILLAFQTLDKIRTHDE